MNIKTLMLDNAPEEQYRIEGKLVTVRRDDKAYLPPLPPNAKMGALWAILQEAHNDGYKKVVMFAKKQTGTSYAVGLPIFAQALGIHPIITYPITEKQDFPDWVYEAIIGRAEVIRLHPNMVSININQSKQIAQKKGAYFVPFGFDDLLSVETHAEKFSLPEYRIGTLIMSTMTGMMLAGTILQIQRRGYKVDKIIGVSGGRPKENIYQSIAKYLPSSKTFENVEIVDPYDRNFAALSHIEPRYRLFDLHPDYEAKAWYWMTSNIKQLKPPIYFVNIGR